MDVWAPWLNLFVWFLYAFLYLKKKTRVLAQIVCVRDHIGHRIAKFCIRFFFFVHFQDLCTETVHNQSKSKLSAMI